MISSPATRTKLPGASTRSRYSGKRLSRTDSESPTMRSSSHWRAEPLAVLVVRLARGALRRNANPPLVGGERVVIGDREKVVAVSLVPVRDGLGEVVAVGPEGVRVGIAAPPGRCRRGGVPAHGAAAASGDKKCRRCEKEERSAAHAWVGRGYSSHDAFLHTVFWRFRVTRTQHKFHNLGDGSGVVRVVRSIKMD